MTKREAVDIILALWKFIDRSHDLNIGIDFELIRRAFNLAIKALEEDWIPCSERLPEYEREVLVYTDADEYIVGFRNNEWGQDFWTTGDFGGGTFDAVAWMLLPEPYTMDVEP